MWTLLSVALVMSILMAFAGEHGIFGQGDEQHVIQWIHDHHQSDSLMFPTPALLGCYRDMLSETLSPEALIEGALRSQ